MKLEPNRFYCTRGGHKAEILREHDQKSRFIGCVFDDGFWHAQSWDEDGNACGENIPHFHDILEEWREPKSGSFFVNIYDGDVISGHYLETKLWRTRQLSDEMAAYCNAKGMKRIACIEVKWTEGDGL